MACLKDAYKFVMNKQDDVYIIHAIVERRSDNLRHRHAVVLTDIHTIYTK